MSWKIKVDQLITKQGFSFIWKNLWNKSIFQLVISTNSLGRKVHVPANFSRNFSGVILRSEICWDGISLRIPEKKVENPFFWLNFQNGGLTPGMVRTTFFLWEINQKLFFLSLSFHILVTRNNNYCHPGGSQWVPGGLLACFKAKNGFFEQFSKKVHVF